MSYRLLDTMTVPPGRWTYKDPATGEPFDGGSLDGTIKLVVKHRAGNRLARQSYEEIDEDVQAQICQRIGPQWCQHMKDGVWGFAEINLDRIKSGTKSLLSWARSALKGEDPYVDEVEANRRAAICAKCFCNEPLRGCYGCGLGDTLRTLLVETKGERFTAYDDRLHACKICGCANAAQVWVRADILSKGVSDHQRECYTEVPDCWKRAL